MSTIVADRKKDNNGGRSIASMSTVEDGSSTTTTSSSLHWMNTSSLCIVVMGASGDLAKKKTYPSLLNLYEDNLLPSKVLIIGFARSKITDDELRNRLRPYLLKTSSSPEIVDAFLSCCSYESGTSYGDMNAFERIKLKMETFEKTSRIERDHSLCKIIQFHRLFYFAIPPSVFAETAIAIKQTSSMQVSELGWTRLIIEKPFGRDIESFELLNQTLSEHFHEEHIYRIDHYLGKEMVQNLIVLRFSNIYFEQVWNGRNIKCVMLTFKEPFGTQGRGGYFDHYGIIRDILQNHLLQVLTLLAMETPTILEGPYAGKSVRDAKVAILNAISPITINDVILGQYKGYTDDETITNKNTNTPTFATIRLRINTPRWDNVPIILKAGKALNERKAEMRIQFHDAPAATYLFGGHATCPRNELVMRMQPDEAIYMKTNVKSPGFTNNPIQSELEVNYKDRFFANNMSNPDAYTRLILDVMNGKQESFVRDDELRRSWQIFTPILHYIEQTNVQPIIYEQGSRGPIESDIFIKEHAGYERNEEYIFYDTLKETTTTTKSEPTSTNKETPKTSTTTTQPTKPTTTAVIETSTTIPQTELCDVGLFGLAVMGQNFALNMAHHGFSVCVGNRSPAKVRVTIDRAKKEGNLPLIGSDSPQDLVAHLKKPRKVIILVQAGKPVDDTISTLARYMEPGDVIVDGGNEWFPNSIRRAKALETVGIHFIGMGISGGEEGARHGPSLMPGGPKEAYHIMEPILTKCAAQVQRTGSCAGYLGPIGAGNYVKMVHNGIEYGDMQLIAEVYDVLKNVLEMSNEEMADLFDEWNKGELLSYLIEITATILRKKDDQTGSGYVVDYVLDKTGMKGTGKWTIQQGAEQGIAVPTMAAALDSRMISGRKEEREAASLVFPDPKTDTTDSLNKEQVINDLKEALYASKICSYAQGLSLIKAASGEYDWNVDLAECARLWTGGCIIRAKLLDRIQMAFSENKSLVNLLVDPGIASEIVSRLPAWRRLVSLCVTRGIACPSLCSSLTYFDSYRRNRLPANLTQAQRDFFGGHTYERIDMDGRYHTAWTNEHKDIGDINQRTEGEKLQT